MITPEEIYHIRAGLGLTQDQAGALVGCDGRTWRRWENGEREVHPAVERLVRLLEVPTVRLALERLKK